MTLADYVRILGRGPGRSRGLTDSEAHAAMQLMLSGDAAPEAVGALLMLLRMKGETADEIAGFARAAQEDAAALPAVDLDWPSYAAGRTRGLPWFLLSAKLVASAGHRVVLHGWNGADAAVRDGLGSAGIGVADTAEEAQRLIARDGIAYLPLEQLAPNLFALLNLRVVLGLRSCINTVARMLNPASAPASVQGVFHPSYRLLQADAAALLGWQSLTVIKGGGGEFERHPSKPTLGFGLRDGSAWTCDLPAQCSTLRRLDDGQRGADRLGEMWAGRLRDPFAEDIIIGTAELALDTLGVDAPRRTAERIWAERDHAAAA
ncbi:glycosyl transferase family protein [Roseobacter sinensis]|uniref:Glycosyl transferase family protein n=1 Tax=Roseobacter sinensis TaxID=2931391 RepID=A0ABT3BG58_9RHOB|nr:glycosyl transferase family protein [Roseobacter sp. WL0113]MCV3272153.1 glycosyl transferase family protein [Roseobacter sp. WL0113]